MIGRSRCKIGQAVHDATRKVDEKESRRDRGKVERKAEKLRKIECVQDSGKVDKTVEQVGKIISDLWPS